MQNMNSEDRHKYIEVLLALSGCQTAKNTRNDDETCPEIVLKEKKERKWWLFRTR